MAPERRLVFTSAGDLHRLHQSLRSSAHFDLLVYFYGDDEAVRRGLENREATIVDRKGGKWPNLLAAHQDNSSLLSDYDAIFVMDDDLALTARQVSRLFDLREQHDLWVAQPAFDRRGAVSYSVSTPRPYASLHYVEMVECNAPLFRTDALLRFLAVYDGTLVGWGTDWWYTHVLGNELNRYAVVDEVVCVNPRSRRGGREIERLQSTEGRIEAWQRVSRHYNVPEIRRPREFGCIWRRPDLALFSTLRESIRIIDLLLHEGISREQQFKRWRLASKRAIRAALPEWANRALDNIRTFI